MAKTMLPVLFCLLYISAGVQGLPQNSQGDRLELIVGHSSVVKEEAGKVFQANAYARGNCEPASSRSSPWNCTATITYFDRKRVTGEHTCWVMSLMNTIDERQEHKIRFLFQKNKAIFVYESDDGNRFFQQYQMVEPRSDGCAQYSTYPIPLGSDLTFIRQMNVATYTNIIVHDDGLYDIITDGDCGGARCKYSYVGEGKPIEGEAYLPLRYRDHAVKVFPSTKSDAHFTIVSEWQSSYKDRRQATHSYYSNDGFSSEKLLYVPRGSEKLPIELANFNYRNVRVPENFVDNSNGLFSLCRYRRVDINYEVHCLQFDERVNVFNATTIISSSERLLTTYNLPKGGILLVKSNCPPRATCKTLTFETWTLNLNDQIQRDLKDIEYSLPIAKVIVHAEDDDQLCITMYDETTKVQTGGYDVSVECFSNTLFKNGARAQNYSSITYLLTCITMLFFAVASN